MALVSRQYSRACSLVTKLVDAHAQHDNEVSRAEPCRPSLPPKKAAAAAASAAAEAQAAADAAAAAVAFGGDDMGHHDLDDREDTPSSGKDEVGCQCVSICT